MQLSGPSVFLQMLEKRGNEANSSRLETVQHPGLLREAAGIRGNVCAPPRVDLWKSWPPVGPCEEAGPLGVTRFRCDRVGTSVGGRSQQSVCILGGRWAGGGTRPDGGRP